MSGTRIASISGLRGVVGDGLSPDDVVRFAAAYAAGCGAGPILVAHDGRPTGPMMLHAVLAGLTASGRDVEVLGAAPTPTVGVLVAHRRAAGAIQITASHNPPEYNGLKFFQPGGMVLGPEQGRAMLGRFERAEFSWSRWDATGRVGYLDPAEIDRPHIARILPLVNVEAIRGDALSILLDSNHGAGGRTSMALLGRDGLECQVDLVGGEPDGRYEHPPEPTEENLRAFAAHAKDRHHYNACFALDPDADRLAIIDDRGRYIGEELTLALAVKHRLSQEIGPVVLNLSSSRVAEDIARAAGAPVIRTPVGEIHVVEAMRREGALIGGEGNGGVIDPRVGWVRDPFIGMALVLDLMAATGKRLSEIVDELPRYVLVKTKFSIGGLAVADVLDRIEHAHPEAAADRQDGLRLDWPDAWAHVRASNTEPIVRVFAEAASRERASALAQAIGRLVIGGPQ